MLGLNFDLRHAMTFILCILGIAILVFGFYRRSKRKSPLVQCLIAFGIFVLISSLYLVEDSILAWLGVSQADEIAQQVADVLWWLSLGYLLTKILDAVLWRGILTHQGELLIPKMLVHLTSFFIYLIVFIFFMHLSIGKDVTALIATSGVLVVGLGYLAKVPFESAFAGIALNLIPMFRKGDYVAIDDSAGTVEDIGWLHVTLKAKEGHLIYLNNLIVEQAKVVNYSQPTQRPCYTTEVTFEYELPLRKGLDLINHALSDLSETIQVHAVCAKEFSRFGITYQIRFFVTDKFSYSETLHSIHSAIYYRMQRLHDYDFGYDKFGSMNASTVVDKLENTHRAAHKTTALSLPERISLLRKVDIFESLREDELSELANASVPVFFGPPEKIINQGDVGGDSMFIIAQGRVQVYLKTDGHEPVEVATSGPGQYFGEMALLTGQPRRATVRALTEVTVLEIPKEGLRPILQRRTEITGAIAEVMAKRQMQNTAALNAADSKGQDDQRARSKIAEAIRTSVLHFFKIHEHHKA